jgi:hypothetical protein
MIDYCDSHITVSNFTIHVTFYTHEHDYIRPMAVPFPYHIYPFCEEDFAEPNKMWEILRWKYSLAYAEHTFDATDWYRMDFIICKLTTVMYFMIRQP